MIAPMTAMAVAVTAAGTMMVVDADATGVMVTAGAMAARNLRARLVFLNHSLTRSLLPVPDGAMVTAGEAGAVAVAEMVMADAVIAVVAVIGAMADSLRPHLMQHRPHSLCLAQDAATVEAGAAAEMAVDGVVATAADAEATGVVVATGNHKALAALHRNNPRHNQRRLAMIHHRLRHGRHHRQAHGKCRIVIPINRHNVGGRNR
jgi:hypothetical protein